LFLFDFGDYIYGIIRVLDFVNENVHFIMPEAGAVRTDIL